MADEANSPELIAPQGVARAPEKPVRTHGDTLFDRWVYGGLNTVGTFIITIPLAYWAEHSKGGEKFFNSGTNKLISTFGMGEKNAEKVMKTTTLGLGGTVMIVPVWLAEHYRKPLVEWFNQHFGSEKDKQTVVENPTPQTFASILKGRAVAWCAVFAGFKGAEAIAKQAGNPAALGQFEDWFSKGVNRALGKDTHDAAKLAALEAKHGRAALTAAEKATAETISYRYGKLAALDVFATVAASSILYVTSRIFAKQHAAKEAAKQAVPTVPAQVAVSEAPVPSVAKDAPETTIADAKHHAGVIAQDVQLHASL